ncbi:muconolactone Delta-isomerase family protein [Leptolyngbya sp. FACHB-261]|uniref:muconolactone Delta-isomerase family protein n=1 Tax=Leptolyngbya sp. FACHB-261 TaxID=2692806 RepID=UPI001681CE4E|nr:muconolactone Delta-isomerase family protein [Leptolyngbya sp. FACHB-261]MBD2102569.1 hypothetical protein [Leptolyngbya sp. FACHB-261]
MQFLMIARPLEGTPIETILPLIKPEAAKSWEYYAAGQIRSMYYIADMSGAVFIWEAPSLEAMNELIAQMPMHQTGAFQFEILPLKPYTGIESLFASSV